MTKGKALACAWTAPIAAYFLISTIVGNNVRAGDETVNGITLIICCIVSGGLAMLHESKKSKPDLQNIALASMFSIVGIGVTTYQLLTGKD